MSKPLVVFSNKKDAATDGGYRIPSLIVTKHGTVIAACDERYYTSNDNPNRIDKVVARSTDNGKTFSQPLIVALKEHGTSKMEASAAIDPALLYDEKTDAIFMLYCHTPAKIFILNNECGVGEDKDGNRLIVNDKKKYYNKNGWLFTEDGTKTQYAVDEDGNVSIDSKYVSNIYTGDGAFNEYPTSYLMMIKSTDDGLTWSKPVSLNHQVKSKKMAFIGPGPGIGLSLKGGRLIFPVYYSTMKLPLMMTCAAIYSDDGGKTWTMGETPNAARGIPCRLFKRLIPQGKMLTESQIIERKDGTLQIFMRNHSSKRVVASALSDNQGESWRDITYHEELWNPICQVSAINFDYKGKETIAVCCAHSKKARKNGVIYFSVDGGKTFPYSQAVREDDFVYSSMAILPDGKLGLLYEPSTLHEEIWFETYDLEKIII